MKIILLSICLLTASCSTIFIGINKYTVDQGNFISQDMINDLEIGMTKKQVIYVLGNPLTESLLNKDLWIYYYSIHTMGEYKNVKSKVTKIHFKDGLLDKIEGKLQPKETEEKKLLKESKQNTASKPSKKIISLPAPSEKN